jgi:hypothetical protein
LEFGYIENKGVDFMEGKNENTKVAQAIEVETPDGTLIATICGSADDYPGISVSLRSGGEERIVSVVEYDNVKNGVQIVNYADSEQDEPTSIEVLRKA